MDREERRRKRTSQGIDRMAFITGRIHSLDPDPYSVSTPNQEDDSSQDHHHANLETASDQRIKEVAIQISSDPTNLSKKPFSGIIFSSMTLKGVNTSIISSENMRAICSIVIAMLVVLLHVTSLVRSNSLIAYRPLHIVLLTDALILSGRLARYSQVSKEEFDGHSWEGAVKLLEIGLVVHQAIRAVFIDCSFYVVIVICGLSLV